MVDSILVLITAVLFYALGRFSTREREVLDNALKQVKKKLNPPVPAGVIDYPTAQELEYAGSEQEKIDQAQERLIKEKVDREGLHVYG